MKMWWCRISAAIEESCTMPEQRLYPSGQRHDLSEQHRGLSERQKG
jgi:hypothetical protein